MTNKRLMLIMFGAAGLAVLVAVVMNLTGAGLQPAGQGPQERAVQQQENQPRTMGSSSSNVAGSPTQQQPAR